MRARGYLRTVVGVLVVALAMLMSGLLAGCQDDVRQTKKIERYEEEPVRMTSPGTEVVE